MTAGPGRCRRARPIAGESREETALREVEEETGLKVRITAPFDSIEYTFVQSGTRIHKTVHYFLMDPIGGDLAGHDHEFDEVRWIPLRQRGHDAHLRDGARAGRRGPPSASPGHDAEGRLDAGRGRLVTDAPDLPIHLTPLTEVHRELGARLIEFGGWLMPVQYGSIIEEHRTVRERVGLFDLSHMGELYVEGPDAGAGAGGRARIAIRRRLAIGRAQYSMICAPDGGVIDDLIVYRLGRGPLPGRRQRRQRGDVVSDALAERLEGFKAVLDDRSLATGLLAVQGPLRVGGPRCR